MLHPVVLIVDDRRSFRMDLRRVLVTECQALVHEAESGIEALTMLDVKGLSTKVDVIAADLKMDGMDGMQLLDHVGERWPSIRRALVTAYTSSDMVDRAEYLVLDKALSYKTIAAYLCELSGIAA